MAWNFNEVLIHKLNGVENTNLWQNFPGFEIVSEAQKMCVSELTPFVRANRDSSFNDITFPFLLYDIATHRQSVSFAAQK